MTELQPTEQRQGMAKKIEGTWALNDLKQAVAHQLCPAAIRAESCQSSVIAHITLLEVSATTAHPGPLLPCTLRNGPTFHCLGIMTQKQLFQ